MHNAKLISIILVLLAGTGVMVAFAMDDDTPGVIENAELAPTITVWDQSVADARVLIQDVTCGGAGWLVIHSQTNDGKVGPAIGFSAVCKGSNSPVVVAIDMRKATETLYGVLHADAGIVGVFEFPGADIPVMVGSDMVASSFKLMQ
jgi:hypothetical protein